MITTATPRKAARIEMDPAGVSIRRVEDIAAACAARVSPAAVTDLNTKIYGTIEGRRNRPIKGERPDVHLDRFKLARTGDATAVQLEGKHVPT